VDLVVREMSAAANLDDARARAGKVLTEFEAVVRERVESGAGAAAKENGVLKEHMQALMKDNHILKRAVQIQNARQLESEEKMKEVHQLKQMLHQYQEQLRTLEVRPGPLDHLMLFNLSIRKHFLCNNERVHLNVTWAHLRGLIVNCGSLCRSTCWMCMLKVLRGWQLTIFLFAGQ
jgi:hypothetical protein